MTKALHSMPKGIKTEAAFLIAVEAGFEPKKSALFMDKFSTKGNASLQLPVFSA